MGCCPSQPRPCRPCSRASELLLCMPYDWRVGLSACQGLACCLLTLPTPSAACGNRRAQTSSVCRGRVRLRAEVCQRAPGNSASATSACDSSWQRTWRFRTTQRRLRLQHSAVSLQHSALADGSTPRCDCWDDMIRMLLQQYFRGLEKLGLALCANPLRTRPDPARADVLLRDWIQAGADFESPGKREWRCQRESGRAGCTQ